MIEQEVKIYVVSLARAAERRNNIIRHLDNLGVSFELVDAVDGAEIPVEERRKYYAEGVDYHPGVLGCYLSHMNIYRDMLEHNFPIACVFEDDAQLNPDFVTVLQQGFEWNNFDYCFLDCAPENVEGPIFYDPGSKKRLAPGFHAYQLHAGPAGTHAYLITLQAAKRRLEHELPIKKPVDVYTDLPYRPRFYAILFPRAAWVSEDSRISTASLRDDRSRIKLKALRRWEWFYRLRDAAKLRPLKANRMKRKFLKTGALDNQKNWKAMPSGRVIIMR